MSAAAEQLASALAGTKFVPRARHVLFPLTRFDLNVVHQQYAVSPDDRRFIMIRSTDSDHADQLVAVEVFSTC